MRISPEDMAVLSAAQKDRMAFNWLAGVGILLLVSFGAIGWLIWRIRQLSASGAPSGWTDSQPIADAAIVPSRHSEPEVKVRSHPVSNDPEGTIDFTSSAEPADTQQHIPNRCADYSFQSRVIAAASQHIGKRGDTRATAVRSDLPVVPVEVISDVIQVAEFWLSLDALERAVEVLESYGTVDRDSSPLPSLYLFDLYRTLGKKEKYEALSECFRLVFNSKVPRWEDRRAKDRSRTLESLPYLVEKISSLWKTESVVPFLKNLLVYDRDGMREGFDLPT